MSALAAAVPPPRLGCDIHYNINCNPTPAAPKPLTGAAYIAAKAILERQKHFLALQHQKPLPAYMQNKLNEQ
jgi:hypothetical protein